MCNRTSTQAAFHRELKLLWVAWKTTVTHGLCGHRKAVFTGKHCICGNAEIQKAHLVSWWIKAWYPRSQFLIHLFSCGKNTKIAILSLTKVMGIGSFVSCLGKKYENSWCCLILTSLQLIYNMITSIRTCLHIHIYVISILRHISRGKKGLEVNTSRCQSKSRGFIQ